MKQTAHAPRSEVGIADTRSFFFLVIAADVFEVRHLRNQCLVRWLIVREQKSYVGGLYLDQGLEAVRSWLGPLLLPDLRKSYCVVREEYGLPPSDGDDPARKATPLAQLNTNTPIDGPRSTWALPPPARYTATSVGHLALFNQCLQQDSKSVEWVYSDSAGEGTKTTPVWVCVAWVRIFVTRVDVHLDIRSFEPLWMGNASVVGEEAQRRLRRTRLQSKD